MPGRAYAGRLAGAVLLGLVTFVIAFLIFVFTLPYLIPMAPVVIPFVTGTMALVLILLVIWGVTYAAAIVGAMIYYFFRPMEVSRKDKGYSIAKTKEAGRREKGRK
jgi:hypothetical protein